MFIKWVLTEFYTEQSMYMVQFYTQFSYAYNAGTFQFYTQFSNVYNAGTTFQIAIHTTNFLLQETHIEASRFR